MSERGTLRGEAHFRASNAHGDYLAVVLDAANVGRGLPAAWHHLDFRNRHIMDVWFRDASLSPDRFVYIAAFDKTTPDWLVEAPIAERHGVGPLGEAAPIGLVVGVDLSALRLQATKFAQQQGELWVAVALLKSTPSATDPRPAPFWYATPFVTKQAMLDWFAWQVSSPASYEYLAIYDKADPRWTSAGAPIAEQRSRVARVGGANGRGEYGYRQHGRGAYGVPRVGDEGSIFGHTPGDVEDELNQLNGEIMAFSQQWNELTKDAESKVRAELEPLFKAEKATTDALFAQTLLFPDPKDPRRREAMDRYLGWSRAPSKVKALYDKRLGEASNLIRWGRSDWNPFLGNWTKFYHEKKDIPLQSWYLSGTWDRIQDFRRQFIDLRGKAPFKATGPTPIEPRKDPSVTGVFGDIGSILKWTVIGALGIGGAVALSSVVANVRKGRDPVEHYVGLYRGRRGSTAGRAALPAREQLALPPGQPERA